MEKAETTFAAVSSRTDVTVGDSAGRFGLYCLEWKKPKDGGPVATYLVQVSHAGKGDWRTASLCFETEITLAEQERGVQLEYQVVALNKAGEGLPSNVVAAVL